MKPLLALLLPLVLADVVPHCGPPRTVLRQAGEDCGAHGPRWLGVCHEPAACFRFDTGGAFCTVKCASDAECGGLGSGFTCTAKATRDDAQGREAVSVCAPAK